MPRNHLLLKLEEVKHLPEESLPLVWVMLRRQYHVEVERQMLVDFGQAFESDHIGIDQGNTSFHFLCDREALRRVKVS